MQAHIQTAHMHLCTCAPPITHAHTHAQKCIVNHFLIITKPFKLLIRFLRTALLTLSTMYFLFADPQGSLRKKSCADRMLQPL